MGVFFQLFTSSRGDYNEDIKHQSWYKGKNIRLECEGTQQ